MIVFVDDLALKSFELLSDDDTAAAHFAVFVGWYLAAFQQDKVFRLPFVVDNIFSAGQQENLGSEKVFVRHHRPPALLCEALHIVGDNAVVSSRKPISSPHGQLVACNDIHGNAFSPQVIFPFQAYQFFQFCLVVAVDAGIVPKQVQSIFGESRGSSSNKHLRVADRWKLVEVANHDDAQLSAKEDGVVGLIGQLVAANVDLIGHVIANHAGFVENQHPTAVQGDTHCVHPPLV
ncbi:hypothetical protein TYRP_010257 [Tyrophagus putrescentiae]|nr:hypothetical protein TYRP_010257 [Tyrophagus putrescentiae]